MDNWNDIITIITFIVLLISIPGVINELIKLFRKEKKLKVKVDKFDDFRKEYSEESKQNAKARNAEHRPILETIGGLMTNNLNRQGNIKIVNKGAPAEIVGINDKSVGIILRFSPTTLRKDNGPFSITFSLDPKNQHIIESPEYVIEFTLDIIDSIGNKFTADFNQKFSNNKPSPVLFNFKPK